MQTTLKIIGLPNLAEMIGSEANIEWPGGTFSDMIGWLSDRHGPEVQQILYDDQGQLDPTIQVMVDTQGMIARDRLHTHPVENGDAVSIVLLAAGG